VAVLLARQAGQMEREVLGLLGKEMLEEMVFGLALNFHFVVAVVVVEQAQLVRQPQAELAELAVTEQRLHFLAHQ